MHPIGQATLKLVGCLRATIGGGGGLENNRGRFRRHNLTSSLLSPENFVIGNVEGAPPHLLLLGTSPHQKETASWVLIVTKLTSPALSLTYCGILRNPLLAPLN